MESKQYLWLIGSFVLGLLVAGIFFSLDGSLTGFVVRGSLDLSDIASPSDTLNQSDFLLYQDKLVIKVRNASISTYEDTKSMAPFLTSHSHGIRIKPISPADVHVGDIISFTINNVTIVHRVVAIKNLDGVPYYTTKGDNSLNSEENISFNEIEWKIVGILY